MNMSMLWFKHFQYLTRMMVCVLVAFGVTACGSMLIRWYADSGWTDGVSHRLLRLLNG